MYELQVSEQLDKLFFKLLKKNKLLFEILNKKIKQILEILIDLNH